MRRHPNISIRTSEHVTAASACISEKDIRKWFNDIYQYLKEEQLCDILNDPSRVFNGDETGFSLCPKTKAVLAPKGSKDVYEVATSNAKENLTVMFTFSAAGVMCHPMLIFNYKRIPQDIVNSVPPNWGIGHSESGWMKSETFYEFVANIFHPFLLLNNIKLPVILFVDGHKSHLTYELSKLCIDLQIILIALYPNSTRILQPADVAAFRPLKEGWKKGVFEWRKQNSVSTAVTKKDFAPILEKVINETINPDILKNGFRACGLYPWNPDNINFNKCLGKNLVVTEPVDDTNILSSDILDLNTYCNIVGPDIVTQFDNIDNTLETSTLSKESQALFKLYKLIKSKPQETHVGNIEILNKKVEKHESSIVMNISDEHSSKDNNCVQIDQDTIYIIPTNSIKINQSLVPEPEVKYLMQNNILITVDDENNFNTTSDNSNFQLEQNTIKIIQQNDTTENNYDIPCAINEQLVTEFKDSCKATPYNNKKKLQVSPIDSCLIWPITPERKGKRNSERVPFVLSSKMWQSMYEQKEAAKKHIADEKENNRKKRLENKKTKSVKTNLKSVTKCGVNKSTIVRNIFKNYNPEKKPETVTSGLLGQDKPKQLSNSLISTLNTEDLGNDDINSNCLYKTEGHCFKCEGIISCSNIGTECELCTHKYHLECLDPAEYLDLGLTETILFICNMCQKALNQ